jgi:alpha-mannosidase
MKCSAHSLLREVAFVTLASALAPLAIAAPTTQPNTVPANDLAKQKTLYAVGYAHLDTQWRWTYPRVIQEYIPNTLRDNFKLFEKYPNYIFNFSGSRRYEMMKEYYPDDYAKLKEYVAQGRWFICGSDVDENDALVPSGESQLRHVLYGNRFSLREFGQESKESMLPDCFGFPASLPSLLHHAGLKGFSTQKLTWGSAVGIPFKVGVWNGTDGNGVMAAFDPGAYTGRVRDDLSKSDNWLARINATGEKAGVYADYHYFGTGDKGGAPGADSVEWVEKSVTSDGPIKVLASRADQMFVDITDEQRAKLPVYQGELLLTEHSAGSPTSQAYMKRWNRKSELLADAAERANVAGMWLGGLTYPQNTFYRAWDLLLGSQMHDMLPGTSVPKAYEYCWNDYVIAQNTFAAAEVHAVSVIAGQLDTQVGEGTPIVVYNPLSIEREDLVEATVSLGGGAKSIRVTGPDGKTVSTQIVSRENDKATILFRAKVPSVGYAVYSVAPQADAATPATLRVDDRALENEFLKVTLNDAGDIASVFDKRQNKEMLRAPSRLAFRYDRPRDYPAWNMDWEDARQEPRSYVSGPATFKVVENGPARVAIEVTRQSEGSTFVQRIELAVGGERVDVVNTIDWNTPERSLKASFPLVASNPQATYDIQLGTVSRGNNEEKRYEVPQQQWIDLTDKSGGFGLAVLNDSKYASDKPSDNEIRLTLLYTPGVRGVYQDQASQDFGRHQITYSLAPHAKDWTEGNVVWNARRLNQPLRAYATTAHAGPLGKTFSLLSTSSSQVEVQAIKKAEDNDEVIVRVKETSGKPINGVTIKAGTAIASAYEANGQERRIGDAKLVDGALSADFKPYGIKTFAIKLAAPKQNATAAKSQPVELAYDTDVASTDKNPSDGKFDGAGRTLAAEMLPSTLSVNGVDFKLGATTDGAKNAVVAKGQTIRIPPGYTRVYLLAAAADGDRDVSFKIGEKTVTQKVQDWGGYVGQWDNRLWSSEIGEDAFNISAKMTGLVPGFIKRDTIAWFSSHRHDPKTGNEFYKYSYLYKYGFDVPPVSNSITLPNDEKVIVLAVSVANDDAKTTPAAPLYDTLSDHKGVSVPSIEVGEAKFEDSTHVAIRHPLYWEQGKLRYTLDGSEPNESSPAYEGPVFLSKSATIRARQYAANGSAGPVVEKKVAIDDRTAPKLVLASAIGSMPQVTLAFNEPLDAAKANVAANYRVEGASVSGAKLADDGKTVTLTLDKPLADEKPTVAISNVSDRSDNANKVSADAVAIQLARPIASVESYKTPAEPLEMKLDSLPVKPGEPWAINLFVKIDRQLDSRTVIAGFGNANDGETGTGRYIAKFNTGVHFWSCNQDVASENKQLETRKWQMLTAAYDGKTLRLYKNGVEIGARDMQLAEDEAVVRIAPVDPWDGRRRFNGEIANFTVWNASLPPATIAQLAKDGLATLQAKAD